MQIGCAGALLGHLHKTRSDLGELNDGIQVKGLELIKLCVMSLSACSFTSCGRTKLLTLFRSPSAAATRSCSSTRTRSRTSSLPRLSLSYILLLMHKFTARYRSSRTRRTPRRAPRRPRKASPSSVRSLARSLVLLAAPLDCSLISSPRRDRQHLAHAARQAPDAAVVHPTLARARHH